MFDSSSGLNQNWEKKLAPVCLVVVVVSLGSGDSTGRGLMKEKYVQLWLFDTTYATFVVVVTEFSCVS